MRAWGALEARGSSRDGFGLYRVLANRPRRPRLEILAKEIRVPWRHPFFRARKMGQPSKLGLRPLGLCGKQLARLCLGLDRKSRFRRVARHRTRAARGRAQTARRRRARIRGLHGKSPPRQGSRGIRALHEPAARPARTLECKFPCAANIEQDFSIEKPGMRSKCSSGRVTTLAFTKSAFTASIWPQRRVTETPPSRALPASRYEAVYAALMFCRSSPLVVARFAPAGGPKQI